LSSRLQQEPETVQTIVVVVEVLLALALFTLEEK
jgi:hypothetical protein